MKQSGLHRILRFGRCRSAGPALATPSLEPARILVSTRLFDLSVDLLAALHVHRQERPERRDDLTARYDAFLLDPGMGPATYVSSDGRIIWDGGGWGVEPTRARALASICVGASKTGIVALLGLLPIRSADAQDCPECAATGWFLAQLLCLPCGGLGWTSASVALQESVLEFIATDLDV